MNVRGYRLATATCLLLAIALIDPAAATTYYVDFAGGSDANAGTSPAQPFKHCPGDGQATDGARGAELAPGDTVIFKGGVLYRGTISVSRSGAEKITD